MIPFLDLPGQHAPIRDELLAAIAGVVDAGSFILGPAVSRFEANFAAYCGSATALGVNSGTSALHLALLACGVGPGDEVITVSMSFVATVAAVVYTGATPVLVDVDPVTWTMDPSVVERAITPRTKAIMPVHLHGQMADVSELAAIADRHGLALVEDAAQAHGAERDGRRAGSVGRVAGFSFYPGKNLGALGEGGAVTTSDAAVAEQVRLLRDWGAKVRYHHDLHAFNYRMDGIQGAALDVKLRHIEEWTERRIDAARWYDRRLDELGIARPVAPAGSRHVYHVYAVRLADRDAARAALEAASIGVNCHYPIPVHLQRAYEHLGYKRGDLPVSEALADEFLSLPMFPGMTEDQVDEVCAHLRPFAPA